MHAIYSQTQPLPCVYLLHFPGGNVSFYWTNLLLILVISSYLMKKLLGVQKVSTHFTLNLYRKLSPTFWKGISLYHENYLSTANLNVTFSAPKTYKSLYFTVFCEVGKKLDVDHLPKTIQLTCLCDIRLT